MAHQEPAKWKFGHTPLVVTNKELMESNLVRSRRACRSYHNIANKLISEDRVSVQCLSYTAVRTSWRVVSVRKLKIFGMSSLRMQRLYACMGVQTRTHGSRFTDHPLPPPNFCRHVTGDPNFPNSEMLSS
jgi:hypothetical protein